jgi:N-methylhydantoinase A/oxoprolinase/acetone carboxylase beta subunit
MVGALRQSVRSRGSRLRSISTERFSDNGIYIEKYLKCANCAFGGATLLHASALMREMGIPRAIVPIHPAQFSAYGFFMTNLRVDRQRTTQLTSTRFDAERANNTMAELTSQCVADLKAQGSDRDIEVYRALEMRYLSQKDELELPVSVERFDPADTEALWTLFHEAHRTRFGVSMHGNIIEIGQLRGNHRRRGGDPGTPQAESGRRGAYAAGAALRQVHRPPADDPRLRPPRAAGRAQRRAAGADRGGGFHHRAGSPATGSECTTTDTC